MPWMCGCRMKLGTSVHRQGFVPARRARRPSAESKAVPARWLRRLPRSAPADRKASARWAPFPDPRTGAGPTFPQWIRGLQTGPEAWDGMIFHPRRSVAGVSIAPASRRALSTLSFILASKSLSPGLANLSRGFRTVSRQSSCSTAARASQASSRRSLLTCVVIFVHRRTAVGQRCDLVDQSQGSLFNVPVIFRDTPFHVFRRGRVTWVVIVPAFQMSVHDFRALRQHDGARVVFIAREAG